MMLFEEIDTENRDLFKDKAKIYVLLKVLNFTRLLGNALRMIRTRNFQITGRSKTITIFLGFN